MMIVPKCFNKTIIAGYADISISCEDICKIMEEFTFEKEYI